MRKFFSDRGVRIGLCAFFICTGIIVCLFTVLWVQAVSEVRGLDITRSEPLAGVDFFGAPFPIKTGDRVSIAQLTEHLGSAGYIASSARERGTYHYADRSLDVYARYPEFPNLAIKWANDVVISIQANGKPVSNAELESVLLRSLPDVRDTDMLGRSSYRRYLATLTELKASYIPDAVLASEDKNFFRHAGVDFWAFFKRVLRGKGASTITMQLARSLLIQRRGWKVIRKLREWTLAAVMEAFLSKEQIIQHYANTVYNGRVPDRHGGSLQLLGLKAAAFHLLGKDNLRQLTLSEAATIVALLPGPNWMLADFRQGNPAKLVAFRNRVLRRMAKIWPGRYQDKIESALSESVVFRSAPSDPGDYRPRYGYFLDALAKAEPIRSLPAGTRIYTTLDPVLQRAAIESINEVLPTFKSRAADLNAGFIAIEPGTGAVRALVGGIDYIASPLNRALTRFSTGSTVKPFIYTAALESAMTKDGPFTAASLLDLSQGSIDGWEPRDYHSGKLIAREALASSSNRAAVVVGKLIGLEKSCSLQRAALSANPICSGPMLLGGAKGSEVSAVAVAEAYTALANAGVRTRAQYVVAVRNHSGYQRNSAKSDRLFSPQAAFVTLQMMRSVIGDQPALNPTIRGGKQLANLPAEAQVAGKTGSGSQGSLWVAVVHPRLVIVIVVATDDYAFLPAEDGFLGGKVSGAIWATFVRKARAKRPWYFEGQFSKPTGVEARSIDPARGCLSNAHGKTEYFITGRLPKVCD